VTITQQSSPGAFTMPLDVRLVRPGGDTTVVVWDSLPVQEWDVSSGRRPTEVRLDPDAWVLQGGTRR
jgi:hypothetical protein